MTTTDIQFLVPTDAENEAYRQCLAFDRKAFLERAAGRSGLLSSEEDEAHAMAGKIVDAALERGAGFNLAAFG